LQVRDRRSVTGRSDWLAEREVLGSNILHSQARKSENVCILGGRQKVPGFKLPQAKTLLLCDPLYGLS